MNPRLVQPYSSSSLAIRQEIQRFESVHPSIYAIYDIIELISDPVIAQQIREHVVCIEGMFYINQMFNSFFNNSNNNLFIMHIKGEIHKLEKDTLILGAHRGSKI